MDQNILSSGPAHDQTFGIKLSAVMNLTNMTNAYLGRRVNVDPSYISRFRSGQRYPRSNSETMNSICRALLDRVLEQNKMNQLAELIQMPEGQPEDLKGAYSMLHRWLFDQGQIEQSFGIEKLFEGMQAYSSARLPVLPPLEEVADLSLVEDSQKVYYGREGLQRAVIRFLGNVLKEKRKELCLYSSQNMNWMIADSDFFLCWKRLMYECINQGVHISIIHNIDRGLHEVTEAITSWLPYYMSGNIESYYCRKQENARFSKNLFLCPGLACIEGSNLAGPHLSGQGL